MGLSYVAVGGFCALYALGATLKQLRSPYVPGDPANIPWLAGDDDADREKDD